MQIELKTFTPEDREEFKKLKSQTQTCDRMTGILTDSLMKIDEMEYWRIDNAKSMHDWALENCPLSYAKMIGVLKRLHQRANERLITETTGEQIISKPKRKSASSKRNPFLPRNQKQLSETNSEPTVESAKKKPVLFDETGWKIPDHLHGLWGRRSELSDALTALSDIKVAIQKGWSTEDRIFTKIHQSVIDDLEAAYHTIANAKPHCVCGDCQGWFEKTKGGTCKSCDSTGLMSKFQYDHLLPEQVKKIRERAAQL